MYSCTCLLVRVEPWVQSFREESSPERAKEPGLQIAPPALSLSGLAAHLVYETQGSTRVCGHLHEYMRYPHTRVSALGYDAAAPSGLISGTRMTAAPATSSSPHLLNID